MSVFALACTEGCNGKETYRRTNGNLLCTVCNKQYWKHPYCAQSKLPDSMQTSSVRFDYFLHVLCDNVHVKL